MSRFKFKPEITDGNLKLSGRNIESLNEIVELFSDSELASITYLDLCENKITNLDGINKLIHINDIRLDDNLISFITEKDIEIINKAYLGEDLSFNLSLKNNPISNCDFIKRIDTKKILFTFKGKFIDYVYSVLDKKHHELTSYFGYCARVWITACGERHEWTHPYHLIHEDILDYGINKAITNYSESSGVDEVAAKSIVEKIIEDCQIKSLAKLNSGRKAPEKSGPCFIATATMGSYDHPTVFELRRFRDEWLMPKKWGRAFVSFYYQYGPIPARFIENSRSLKAISYALFVKPLHVLSKLLMGKV